MTGNTRPAQEGLSLLPWCAASRGVKSPGAPVWNTMGSLAKHFTASKTGLSYGNNITGQTVLDTKPVGREDSGKRTAERFSLAGSGDEKVPEHPPHLLSEQTNRPTNTSCCVFSAPAHPTGVTFTSPRLPRSEQGRCPLPRAEESGSGSSRCGPVTAAA